MAYRRVEDEPEEDYIEPDLEARTERFWRRTKRKLIVAWKQWTTVRVRPCQSCSKPVSFFGPPPSPVLCETRCQTCGSCRYNCTMAHEVQRCFHPKDRGVSLRYDIKD